MRLRLDIRAWIERKAIGTALVKRRIELVGEAREFVGETARHFVPEDRRMALAQAAKARGQLELVRVELAPGIVERATHLRLHALPLVSAADADARRTLELRFEIGAMGQRGSEEHEVLDASRVHAHRVERIGAGLAAR